jgi:DNA-binding CsgD family transcriptional regulator
MDAPPIQYVTTPDGWNIAFAVSGAGQPLLFMPPAVNHVELAWHPESISLPLLTELRERFRLIQFDGRGQGLSERNVPESTSMADLLCDLTAVINQVRTEPLVFVGHGATSHVMVNYAALHPERVRALVFLACSAANTAWPESLWKDLAANNWENFLLSINGVSGYHLQAKNQLERMRQIVTQSDWITRERAYRSSDITETLRILNVPVLVMRPRMYLGLDPQESLHLAALNRNSRFVLYEGETPFGDSKQAIAAIEAFLADLPPDEGSAAGVETALSLSPRELEVLRMIVRGLSNQQIADKLVISVRTVERHINHIYAKTGAHNKAQAMAYALRSKLAAVG